MWKQRRAKANTVVYTFRGCVCSGNGMCCLALLTKSLVRLEMNSHACDSIVRRTACEHLNYVTHVHDNLANAKRQGPVEHVTRDAGAKLPRKSAMMQRIYRVAAHAPAYMFVY